MDGWVGWVEGTVVVGEEGTYMDGRVGGWVGEEEEEEETYRLHIWSLDQR